MTASLSPTADDVDAETRSTQEAALDAFFESFYRRRPVTATFTGIHEHDHVLPDFSPELMQSARDEMCQLRRRLAEAGLGVLHSEELRGRDWPAIDGALADRVAGSETFSILTKPYDKRALAERIRAALG